MDIAWIILGVCAVIGSVVSEPCTEYTTLDEMERNVTQVTPDGSNMLCDRLLTPGWYRFRTGEMPTTCVRAFHCGTHIPLWLSGTLPTTVGEERDIKTCGDLRNEASCCSYTTGSVMVRYCGGYFVYKLLPTPGCSVAYCAGANPLCTGDKYSETGFPPCNDAYPKLTHSPVLSGPKIEATDFSFSCQIPYPVGSLDAIFVVTWLLDGHPIPGLAVQTVSGTQREVTLKGEMLKTDLDKDLTCSVQTKFLDGRAGTRVSPGIQSNAYWIGVKFVSENVTLDPKTNEQTVTMLSTVPVVCTNPGDTRCSVNFVVSTDNKNLFTESCTIKVTPANWNVTSHTSMTSFNVTTSPNIIPTPGMVGHITLHPVVNGTGIEWHHVPPLSLTVDKHPTPGGARCISNGDPHITTFDHKTRHYDNYKTGQFTMVRQKKGTFRVEARTRPCGRASCNCGIAAREGNDVITMNFCHGTTGSTVPELRIQKKQMFRNETDIVKSTDGKHIVLKFRSGATVTINVRLPDYPRIDFTITVPSSFQSNTEGLCGTYDGNPDNDLRHPNGHVSSMERFPNAFTESWRVPVGTSLFEKADPIPEPPKEHCYCDVTNKVTCSNKPLTVDPKLEILSYQCPGCVAVDPPELTLPIPPPDNVTVQITPGPVTAAPGMIPSFTDSPQHHFTDPFVAKQTCENSLTKFPSARKCIQDQMQLEYADILDMCVTDLQVTGDQTMAIGALNVLMEGCTFNTITNPNITTSGVPTILNNAKLCPGACSGTGECFHGVCACLEGFEGADCSLLVNIPPNITAINGGNACDQEANKCTEPILIGANMKPDTKCRLELIKVTSDGPMWVHTETVPVVYHSTNHVTCPLPASSTAYSGLRHFNVSLTNDAGATWSNTARYAIYSSKCATCDSNLKCSTLTTACLIDGRCEIAGAFMPSSSTWVCNPSVDPNGWVQAPTTPRLQTSPISPTATSANLMPGTPEYYTATHTGCSCVFEPSRADCACCQNFGCPCFEDSPHTCYDCIDDSMCYA